MRGFHPLSTNAARNVGHVQFAREGITNRLRLRPVGGSGALLVLTAAILPPHEPHAAASMAAYKPDFYIWWFASDEVDQCSSQTRNIVAELAKSGVALLAQKPTNAVGGVAVVN